MRRKKFSKVRFYSRLNAQQLSKYAAGGYVRGGKFPPIWQLQYSGFPDLSKAAGKAAERLKKVGEALEASMVSKFQTGRTHLLVDGCDFGQVEDFGICGSETTIKIRM
ncbi:hypothetical protein MMP64_12140 [Acinetobacter sp. ANC 5659]|uniref:hypothetical protein n=1 Tax=Acinetobacter higginsii TaxID=70347 RepID=UPI0002CECB0F|nr:hypothetical protein [Acinetobacter higginsii]ENX60720.1 hypothetical protein F885_01828 [Acinetobacter higginsii]MCH7318677.1 hypothetical protein [Acinetobacter higginsii]